MMFAYVVTSILVVAALLANIALAGRYSCPNEYGVDCLSHEGTANGIKYCMFSYPEKACLIAGEWKKVSPKELSWRQSSGSMRAIGCMFLGKGGRAVAADKESEFNGDLKFYGFKTEVSTPKTACDQRDAAADKPVVLESITMEAAATIKSAEDAFGKDAAKEFRKEVEAAVAKLKSALK